MDAQTVERYRREFPVTERYVYLDHAGIAPLSNRVLAAVGQHFREAAEGGAFYYPSWAKRTAEIRNTCARLINAGPDEIAFVRSTSHGLSLVAEGLDWKAGDNVLFSEQDFPSNIYPWMNLARKGVEARPVRSTGGAVSVGDIEARMDRQTRLVAVSTVQFSNGYRIDLKQLGRLCRERRVLLCVDAIQSLGVIPLDVRDSCIDFLSADAHKWLLGPEGIGIFYCRKELAGRLSPAIVGWKSVQNEFDFEHPRFLLKTDAQRFEEGSQNLLGIFGLGAAVDLLLEVGIGNIEDQVHHLGEVIMAEAAARGFRILTPAARNERGGNVTIAGNFDPVIMRDTLREQGIMVNVRGGGLRISPHFYNRAEDIGKLFTAIDKRL